VAINVYQLMALPSDRRYELLADRFHAHRLWAHEELFAVAFADAVDLLYRRRRGDRDVRRFVDYTFLNLITRPGDLVALCRHLATEDLCLTVVEAYVHHPLTPHHVVVAMGGSGEVYRELPASIEWTEAPIYGYAMARLSSEADRRFDVHELFPYGTVHSPLSAQVVLNHALEADRLTDRAKAALDAGPIELPMPVFIEGQRVRVVLNDRNRTLHHGMIRGKIWHYENQQWYFQLHDHTGSKINKRYAAEDLHAGH